MQTSPMSPCWYSGTQSHRKQTSARSCNRFLMQARHNRRFRQSLAGRRRSVAMCPICGRKGVLRKIQGRPEETSDILSSLPPTCASRPPRCARDPDLRRTSLVPSWDWGQWYTQPASPLGSQVTVQSDVCVHLSPLHASAFFGSFLFECEARCAQKLCRV
jgi:hypothetical protein